MFRIGVAGFLHESNTFLSIPTSYEAFASTSLTRGAALLERWQGARHELGGMLEGAREQGWTIAPLLATFAVPSGAIEAGAFARIARELLAELEAALPLDGLLLALHGATVSEQHPDADGEILRRLRARLGPDFPIVTTFDLHANLSEQMARHATALIGYRSNPHLDQYERGLDAAALLAKILAGQARPVQALETPPMVIEIARQHTAQPPAAGLYQDLAEALRWPGILSASVAMGFPYADVAEMGASFLAVADQDPGLARRAARWMAERAWERRHEFVATLPSVEEAVRYAGKAERTPVALMDIGDNVGGGSAGDSTHLLAEILRQGVPNALVILYDPAAVQSCLAAGVRQTVDLEVGGKTDLLHGSPIRIRGRVRTLSDGFFVETQVRHGGWTQNDQGITAVVETAEGHSVVLTSRRMAPMSLEQVLSLGIKPERKRVLVVKGVVAPRAAYEPVAAEILLVDSPGATANSPRHFPYARRRKPLFPLEPEAAYLLVGS